MPSLRLTASERLRLGERLARTRWALNLSQRSVGDALGVTGQAVANWERGSLPGAELRPAIADLYGVPEAELFAEYYAYLAPPSPVA